MTSMELKFDDLESEEGLLRHDQAGDGDVPPRARSGGRGTTRSISVDDHLVEPPHMFEGRVPARFADLAPRVEVDEQGMEYWALRRQAALQGRAQRRRRPPAARS